MPGFERLLNHVQKMFSIFGPVLKYQPFSLCFYSTHETNSSFGQMPATFSVGQQLKEIAYQTYF